MKALYQIIKHSIGLSTSLPPITWDAYSMVPLSASRYTTNLVKSPSNKSRSLRLNKLSISILSIISLLILTACSFKSNKAPPSTQPLYDYDDTHFETYATNHIESSLVSNTPRYLVRDWSLRLGFNNMRYIIETGLLHAQLLNRTLILPSHLYARNCDVGLECSKYWQEISLTTAVFRNTWEPAAGDGAGDRAWVVPIGLMLDLDELKKRYGHFLLVSDYLKLHSLQSTVTERRDGAWDPSAYSVTAVSYDAIERPSFINSTFTRVDELNSTIPKPLSTSHPLGGFSAKLIILIMQEYFSEGKVAGTIKPPMKMEDFLEKLPGPVRIGITKVLARTAEGPDQSQMGIVRGEAMMGFVSGRDAEIELIKRWIEVWLLQNRRPFVLLRTYADSTEAFLAKPTQRIEYSLAIVSRTRGFVDDYGAKQADVLHLKGEFHDVIKPGAFYFTSAIEQARFTKIILYDMRTFTRITKLADKLDAKMRALCGGRQWMGAHMRRGDFPPDWVVSPNSTVHLSHIKNHLAGGLEFLESTMDQDVTPGGPDRSGMKYELPRGGDPFYIATDERDPAILEEIKIAGGIMLSDLLSPKERSALGHEALLSDWLGLIERSLLARSAFFFGARLSSFTGGVINERVTLRKGWNTIATE